MRTRAGPLPAPHIRRNNFTCEVTMSLPLRTRPGVIGIPVLLIAMSAATAAQPASSTAGVAEDADVQGAKRLFTAWIEGQLLERGLPGVAVGVVSDQDLVWATGFGLADTAARVRMTPQTKLRMA